MKSLFAGIFLILLASCSKPTAEHWTELVPDSTPFVVVPEEGTTIADFLSADYIPMFDDITPSAVSLTSYIEQNSPASVPLEAMLLFPDTANDWQPIWISQAPNGVVNALKQEFQKDFEQNRYRFEGFTIEKLFISDREFFVVELNDLMIFSESSLGIESMLRTLSGEEPAMALNSSDIRPGSLIANTNSLDRWVQQVAQVAYRPGLMNILEGGSPVSLAGRSVSGEHMRWQLGGTMQIDDSPSLLLRSISSAPASFTLDRYIPVSAAAFSILRVEPRRVPRDDVEPVTEADEFVQSKPEIWQNIAASLDDEIAFAAFEESGADNISEFLYLRKINDAGEIRSQLNRLADEGHAIRNGNNYSVNSPWLAQLLGSELNPMNDFYVTVYSNYAAMAVRRGLVQSVGSDASRRRVMYYDDDYMDMRESLDDELSAIFYMDSARFSTFLQPWLYPQNYFGSLVSDLGQFVITSKRSSDQLDIALSSFEYEVTDRPFQENWIFPLDGSDLTGTPVLADLTGSSRNEIIFSSENGEVYALATDGTTVMQVSTDGDTPVGPPVVYDWYGNNQYVIMQAAGNRIYAWNNNGTPLPNFPINLNETITTPLTITDVTRNSVAEIVVGTSDRRLHILDSRGQAINGWPQNTNAVIRSRPMIDTAAGQRTLTAFAENTLHSWQINGDPVDGFPVFLPTQLHDSPARHENHILASGLDGNLYSIGSEPLFADTLASTHSSESDELYVQSLQIANSGLASVPSVHNLMLRVDDELVREDLILVQSSNGSLFLYNTDGEIRLSRTMGQPASSGFTPRILDLDSNNRYDVVALADFGRLYAWDVISGQRLYDLPTTGMRYPMIGDLTGNGFNEIVAQTRDGLRSWTIFRTRRDAEAAE